jgi:hypothetical protein
MTTIHNFCGFLLKATGSVIKKFPKAAEIDCFLGIFIPVGGSFGNLIKLLSGTLL